MNKHHCELVPSYVGEATEGNGSIWDNGVNFWTPQPVGCMETDMARGRQYAEEALAIAKQYGNSAAVLYPLVEMARRGDMSNLELGFIDRIAEAARLGSMN